MNHRPFTFDLYWLIAGASESGGTVPVAADFKMGRVLYYPFEGGGEDQITGYERRRKPRSLQTCCTNKGG